MSMFSGPIAQLEELPAHNRLVPGSSPGGPTIGFIENKSLVLWFIGKVVIRKRFFNTSFLTVDSRDLQSKFLRWIVWNII